MAYPKPLSEKTLARMYREANIDEEKSEFLHKYFLACANLYGAVALFELWEILKIIADEYGMEKIKRKDLIAFSSIARREDVPYYVYEVDELYSGEKRRDVDRFVVHKSIIQPGYIQKKFFYLLLENQGSKPPFISGGLLKYADPAPTAEDKKLLGFLKKLKVTASEAEGEFGEHYVCEHVGETLGSFSFRSDSECFLYNWYGGERETPPIRNAKILKHLDEQASCSEAEKIFRRIKEDVNIGIDSSGSFEYVFSELNEVGVRLTERQINKLLKILMDYNNNSHLWCNFGWTPSDMAFLNMHGGIFDRVSSDPKTEQPFANDFIDRDEIESALRKLVMQNQKQ